MMKRILGLLALGALLATVPASLVLAGDFEYDAIRCNQDRSTEPVLSVTDNVDAFKYHVIRAYSLVFVGSSPETARLSFWRTYDGSASMTSIQVTPASLSTSNAHATYDTYQEVIPITPTGKCERVQLIHSGTWQLCTYQNWFGTSGSPGGATTVP